MADLYDAPIAIPEPGAFDLVFVTCGAINWLPDVERWADIVARFLKPGGTLYLAEGHPAALVLDDAAPRQGDMPGWFAPYFGREPLVTDNPLDYADATARLRNARAYEWIHPLGDIVSALLAAGLKLEWLHELDAVPWRMFDLLLVKDTEGMYRWPDKAWLPLAFSLKATSPL